MVRELVFQQLEELVVSEDALAAAAEFARRHDVGDVVRTAQCQRNAVLLVQFLPALAEVVAAPLVHLPDQPPYRTAQPWHGHTVHWRSSTTERRRHHIGQDNGASVFLNRPGELLGVALRVPASVVLARTDAVAPGAVPQDVDELLVGPEDSVTPS